MDILYKMIDPTIDDYLNGKIYCLVSKQTDQIYIGSTKDPLPTRFAKHQTSFKTNRPYTSAFDLLQYEDVEIKLLKLFPTTNKYFLDVEEGLWIENMDCVNKNVPGRGKEYINNYDQGKIYKITSKQTDQVYVGSTTLTLPERYSGHKSGYKNKRDYLTAFEILQFDDAIIELIQLYPTTSSYFLRVRERYWIEALNSVNKVIPTRTQKEWRLANIDIIKIKRKQYKIDHKEEIDAYNKRYDETHKAESMERSRKYRENNKNLIKINQAKYVQSHKKEVAERNKLYVSKNKEKVAKRMVVYNKKYKEENKERIKEQDRIRYLKNQDKIRNQRRVRDANKKLLKKAEDTNKKVHERVTCSVCNKNLSETSINRHMKIHTS